VTPRLIVTEPGVLASIQDLGRFGYRRFGVPQSGVLQPPLAKIANVLAGNCEDAAVLEFFQIGPTFHLAEGSLRLAVAGECHVKMTRNGSRRMFRAWRSVTLQAGDTLQVGPVFSGKAGYIAVAGGFSLPSVMNSHSTYLRGRFGGLDGDLLRPGTCLPVSLEAPPQGPNQYLPSPPPAEIPGSSRESIARFAPSTIRIIPGPQDDYFTEEALDDFLGGTYTVSRDSDRMGSRLEGPRLAHRPDKKPEIVSDGMVPGAIQVPGSGAPIVMLADGPTVGGYPKIATVISVDLPKLAAMTPGSRLLFKAVAVDEAEALLRDDRERLAALLTTIVPLPWISEPF
jgi:5-oxoprolinase (ATP-hydrolysing) subunit C